MAAARKYFLVGDVGATNARLAIATRSGGAIDWIHEARLADASFPTFDAAIDALFAGAPIARTRDCGRVLRRRGADPRPLRAIHQSRLGPRCRRDRGGAGGCAGDARQRSRGRSGRYRRVAALRFHCAAGTGPVPGWRAPRHRRRHRTRHRLRDPLRQGSPDRSERRRPCGLRAAELAAAPALCRADRGRHAGRRRARGLRRRARTDLRDAARRSNPTGSRSSCARSSIAATGAAAISRFALERADPLASDALDLFIDCYGTVAGDHALALLPYGGVFVVGGIAAKILPRLAAWRLRARLHRQRRVRRARQGLSDCGRHERTAGTRRRDAARERAAGRFRELPMRPVPLRAATSARKVCHRARAPIARQRTAHGRRAREDRRLLARGQLPLRRPDLPLRQPAARGPAHARAHQAAPARPLGHDPRPQLHLHALEPRDRRARPLRAVRHRPRPRRAGARRQHVSRGHLQRALPRRDAGQGGPAPVVQAVLVSRRHSEPRRGGNAGLDPRGRRAGLRARARVRRRLRQPRPDRRLRDRRRRGRDGSAGRELAGEQVPESGARRRRAADPAPERLQDRRADGACTHPARRAPGVSGRRRPRPVFRRG